MKKAGNKKWIWIIGLSLLPFAGITQSQNKPVKDSNQAEVFKFTIQQTIDYAKKNSLQVKNALLDIELQEQVNREFTSGALPHISGSIGATYNPNVATQVLPNFISPATYSVLIDQGVKDGNGNPIQMPADFGYISAQFGTKYNASAGVTLSQILFDGQVFVGLKARSSAIALRSKAAELTEESIRANVYKVYYQLVVGKSQLELLDANIERLNKLLHDTREIYKNGFAEKLDVEKLEVQSTNLETEKQAALNSLSNGYLGLKMLIGMPVNNQLILTDTLGNDYIKDGFLEAGNYSYDDRKDYQLAQITKKLNEYNIRRYKLGQIPAISLNGNYAKSAQRNKFNFFGKGDWFSISSANLSMAVPIFNGFATRSRIQQAKIELRRSENNIEALKISIDNSVEVSKNNFRSAISSMDFQKKNMALAETVYNQTKKKYELGTGSNLEITSAQADLKAAQTNYINSLYNAIIAKIDFLKATGKL